MLTVIGNVIWLLLCGSFGWKASEWHRQAKRLRSQNKKIQKELAESTLENYEMKVQLGLPPHRRLMLLSEPDPKETISDASMQRERELKGVSGLGMHPLILAGAAIVLATSKAKKKERESMGACGATGRTSED